MYLRIITLAACLAALTLHAAEEPKALVATDATHLIDDIKTTKSPIVVVNVWATWCVPCRREFPHFVKLRQQYHDQGIEVYFVSADFDDSLDQARDFLAKQGVTWTSYLKAQKDEPFIAGLDKDWSGALPATFVYQNGKRVDFWEKPVEYDELKTRVTKLLN